VVIGSGRPRRRGAGVAETAGHVTMLQRSPSYFIALPGGDGSDGAVSRAFSA